MNAGLIAVNLIGLDWPSIGWVALLALLTWACLAVKSRYSVIAECGRGPALLANVVIGYFSIGMLTFGVTAAARAHFPVPGGTAWDGAVAVIGGIAAVTIGGCTLLEHAVTVRARQRQLQPVPLHVVE